MLLDKSCIRLGELEEKETAIAMGEWLVLIRRTVAGNVRSVTAQRSLALFDRPIYMSSSQKGKFN